jgi:hypothetical protein
MPPEREQMPDMFANQTEDDMEAKRFLVPFSAAIFAGSLIMIPASSLAQGSGGGAGGAATAGGTGTSGATGSPGASGGSMQSGPYTAAPGSTMSTSPTSNTVPAGTSNSQPGASSPYGTQTTSPDGAQMNNPNATTKQCTAGATPGTANCTATSNTPPPPQ